MLSDAIKALGEKGVLVDFWGKANEIGQPLTSYTSEALTKGSNLEDHDIPYSYPPVKYMSLNLLDVLLSSAYAFAFGHSPTRERRKGQMTEGELTLRIAIAAQNVAVLKAEIKKREAPTPS